MIATTMIYILNFIYLSPGNNTRSSSCDDVMVTFVDYSIEKQYAGTHIAEEEEEDVIRNCLVTLQIIK